MSRIISLLASSTEIICELGFEKQLVGISHECDYPRTIRHLPVCTAPKFRTDVSSREIDQSVFSLVKNGLSVYQVDVALLEKLKPDFIVTQSQCEVCAVSYKDVEAAVCQLIGSKPQIINLEPNDLSDVFRDIFTVAKALGAVNQGIALKKNYDHTLDHIKSLTTTLPNKPTVATIEWIDPLMFAANWVPEMIELAGGINLFGEQGKHSHYFDWHQLLEKDPDIIIVLPCGFDIERCLQEMNIIASKPGYGNLKAVKNNAVFVTNGNEYFNRPGPRIVDSIEIMAEIFHPDLFPKKYAATYVRFEPAL